MTPEPLTAAEVAVLHDPDQWYEAFAMVSGDEARTPEGRRVIYTQWRAALRTPNPAEPDEWRRQVDIAYRERNAVVAALIRTNGWPAWYLPAPDAEGWFIVYAESDEGQLSWHVGPSDIDLFNGWMGAGARAGWDGWDRHTTEEKYRRVAALRNPAPAEPDPKEKP